MNITIQADLSQVVKALERVRRDQVPFATSVALNNTAIRAQEAVKNSLPEHFRDRGTGLAWIRKGINVERSQKTRLQATVYARDWFLKDQEEGGERRPLSAQFERVPGRQLAGLELKPKVADLLSQPGTFQATNEAGEAFIARRVGADPYPLQILYFLRPQVRILPRFDMAKTVETTVKEVFAEEFDKAAQKAMATAK